METTIMGYIGIIECILGLYSACQKRFVASARDLLSNYSDQLNVKSEPAMVALYIPNPKSARSSF